MDSKYIRELSSETFINLIHKYCTGSELTNPRSFDGYVWHGSAFFDFFLQGLTATMAKPTFTEEVLNDVTFYDTHSVAEITKQFFLSRDALVWWLLSGFLPLLALAAMFLLSPFLCSEGYRRCLGERVCRGRCLNDRQRKAPLQEVSRKNRALRWTLIGVLFCLYPLVLLGAIGCSIMNRFVLSSPLCNAARSLYELQNGILYDQKSGESRWLPNIGDEGGVWQGFSSVTSQMEQIEETVQNSENLAAALSTSQLADDLVATTLNSLSLAYPALDSFSTALGETRLICPVCENMKSAKAAVEKELETLSSDVVTAALECQEQTETFKEKLLTMAGAAAASVNVIPEAFKLDYYAEKFVESHKGYSDLTQTVFILGLIISVLCAVGWIASIATTLYLRFLYKHNLDISPKRWSIGLSILWFWISAWAVIVALLAIGGFGALSATQQSCDIVHSVPQDPQYLRKFAFFRDVYERPETARVLEVCMSNVGNGDLIKATSADLYDSAEALQKETAAKFETRIGAYPTDDQKALFNGPGEWYSAADLMLVPNVTEMETKYGQWVVSSPKAFFSASDAIETKTFRLSRDKFAVVVEQLEAYNDFISQGFPYLGGETCGITSPSMTVPTEGDFEVTITGIREVLDEILESIYDCANIREIRSLCAEYNDPVSGGGEASFRVCSSLQGSGETDVTFNQQALLTNFMDFQASPPSMPNQDNLGPELNEAITLCNAKIADFFPSANQPLPAVGDQRWCYVYRVQVAISGIHWIATRLLAWKALQDIRASTASSIESSSSALADLSDKLGGLGTYGADNVRAAWEEVRIEGAQADCRSAALSVGTVIDSYCSAVQGSLLGMFAAWLAISLLSIGLSVLIWKLWHYAKNRCDWGSGDMRTLCRNDSFVHYVIQHGSTFKIREMTEITDVSDTTDEYRNTALHIAAYRGDVKHVRHLVENSGCALDSQNVFGYTPLAVAAAKGHVPVVTYLLQRGADPRLLDAFGETALHSAARAGHFEVVEAFVKCDTDKKLLSGEKKLPYEVALDHDHQDIADMLVTSPVNREALGFP